MNQRRQLQIPSSGVCLISLSKNSDMQNSLYSMFSALSALGYNVWTVGAKDPCCSNASFTERNIYVDCPDRPGVAKGTFDIAVANRVVAAIRLTGCKTVYFESVHIWNCYILARLGKGFASVSALHDVVPHDGSKSVYACQWLQCRLSDYVAVKSAAFVSDCECLYGVAANRILTVGVCRDWPSYEFSEGDGSCLFFGRVRKYKGLSAMNQIIREMPDTRFVVMGSPDEESRPALEETKNLSNASVVDREVSDFEMRDAFRRSSWVLLPYESASQSGVIIDAYKYGRPVVAFDVGAVGNQVVDGKTGFLVPPGNVRSFVDAVSQAAVLTLAEYSSMAECAYEFGRKQYAAESVAESFAQMLNISKSSHSSY